MGVGWLEGSCPSLVVLGSGLAGGFHLFFSGSGFVFLFLYFFEFFGVSVLGSDQDQDQNHQAFSSVGLLSHVVGLRRLLTRARRL